MNLSKWGARVANWKHEGKTDRPIEYHIAHLHEEVSEVFKAWRTIYPDIDGMAMQGLNPFAHTWEDKGHPEGFGIELADVVLVALFIAEVTGVDIERMMEIKMSYNESRRAKS